MTLLGYEGIISGFRWLSCYKLKVGKKISTGLNPGLGVFKHAMSLDLSVTLLSLLTPTKLIDLVWGYGFGPVNSHCWITALSFSDLVHDDILLGLLTFALASKYSGRLKCSNVSFWCIDWYYRWLIFRITEMIVCVMWCKQKTACCPFPKMIHFNLFF